MKSKKSNSSPETAKWMVAQLKGEWGFLVILSLIVCFSSVADILVAYVLKLFTDAATNTAEIALSQIVIIAAGVLTAVGFTAIVEYITKARVQSRIEMKVRRDIMTHIFNGDFSKVQKLHTADTLTKLTNDASAVAAYYPRFVSDIFGGILEFVFAIVALFVLNAKIALLITIVMPLLILGISLFNVPIGKADEKQKQNEEQNRVLMQEYLDLTKVIKLFGMKDRCMSKLQHQFEKTHKSKIHFGVWEGVAFFLNSLTGNAMLLITLGVGAYFVQRGETTVGTLMAMVQLFNYILNPFSRVSRAVSENAQARTSSERILSVLNLEQVAQKKVSDAPIAEININNIWFGYNDDSIIKGANAQFKSGNSYCIAGENGSGKTTLINLLAGLYTPTDGTITAKDKMGQSIKDISNQIVSFVPAEPTLFSESIENNITMFAPSKDSAKFKKVVRMLNVDTFASSFENGYDTVIGQHGSTVSSGQSQRIAIARAIYMDSGVIIFDEPTSNLDKDSIAMLKEVIAELKKERIVIVVSHEPSFTTGCDYCYHLANGVLSKA